MGPGDVFVMNDPFDGGIHLQDIFVFRPVYLDGALIGFATTTAHHGDVGGRLPALRRATTRDLPGGHPAAVAEALRRGRAGGDGVRGDPCQRRIPRMTLGDLAAQVAATTVAERELQAARSALRARAAGALMTGLVEHTEAWCGRRSPRGRTARRRSRTTSTPTGSSGATCPSSATVTIDGDEITVDLTESAPMVAGALNSTRSFVQACVYQAVRSALEVEVPNTSGAFRPITVLTKPGTIAHVVMPGARRCAA
jgi:N-methylhydantoinase B